MPENCFLINSNGFIKKQDNIPRNEKDLAKARRKDYFARKEAGTYE
jgi:phage-related protein